MIAFFLFVFGASFGSFLNVLVLRYDAERFLFGKHVLFGRSRCPECLTTLKWFELIPVLSFVFLAGRCGHCKTRISFQYPIVEILCGLIFVFVPLRIWSPFFSGYANYLLSVAWILVFLILFLIFLIDIRLRIIPDEANILLVILGFLVVWFSAPGFGLTGGSFLGPYGLLFGWRSNIFLNHFLAAILAGAFFGGIILVTRGRGMGMGDLKLAVPLGLIFGWPDILVVVGLGFVLGAVVGAYEMLFKKKSLKGLVPFGPFLAAASLLVFFFGQQLCELYFKLVPL